MITRCMRLPTVGWLLATLAVVLAPQLGHGDIQVSYTVDDKALRAAITGTQLTFTLWSDPGCTTQIGPLPPIAIDDVDLIERLKRFKPIGGAKPPNTARLTEVLVGLPPNISSTLAISVAGTGITPVGGACQLQYSSLSGSALPCASQVGDEVTFSGCNVNIVNGTGYTGDTNGLGNLVVGYNEDFPFPAPKVRTGSHNVVIGNDHTYSSDSGLVAGGGNSITDSGAAALGGGNTASGPGATVTGGRSNVASGPFSTVSGGLRNEAGANFANDATVSGGGFNVAAGHGSTVSGGDCNYAGPGPAPACTSQLGGYHTVSGGQKNQAIGEHSSVCGGESNKASGANASVSGGEGNEASAISSSVSGGQCNLAGTGSAPACTAHAGRSSVSGGSGNVASGDRSSVSGGGGQVASGSESSVSGGLFRSATGANDWVAGALFQGN